MTKLFLFLLALLILAGSAEAATRYAVPSGGGTTNCTNIATPCTAKAAIEASTAGDTVLFRAGTYTVPIDSRAGNTMGGAPSGSSGNPFTIAAYPGNCVTAGTRGPGGGCESVTLTGSTSDGVIVPKDWWVVDGFRIDATNALYGINVESNGVFKNLDIFNSALGLGRDGMGIMIQQKRSGNTIQNSKIHDLGFGRSPTEPTLGSHGIYWQGNHNTADNIEIGPGISMYGIQFFPGIDANDNVLKNSLIHHTALDAGGGGTTDAGQRNEIFNNVIRDITSGDGCAQLGGNSRFYNNTVTGCNYGLNGGNSGATYRNNIVHNNSIANIFTGNGLDGGTNTFSNNLCNASSGPCTIGGNPQFNANYSIQSTSAARNAGTNTLCPTTDAAGTKRPQEGICDIGAYEFGATGSSPVVTILQPAGCAGTSSACTTSTGTLTLTGFTTSGSTVTAPSFACDRCTGGAVSGTTSWTISGIVLKAGVQTLTATEVDGAGNSAAGSIVITYAPSFPGNTLEGAWAFEEGSGSIVTDSSGNGNTGSLLASPSRVSGKFGQGIALNGTSQYINIPDSNSLDFTRSFTLSLWLNLRASHIDFRAAIVKNSSVNDYVIALYASNDGSYCSAGSPLIYMAVNGTNGPSYAACAPPLPIGTPVHLAATYDNAAAALKIYVNGVQAQSVTASGYMEPSTGALTIGRSDTYGEYLDANWVDEVRAYNWAIPLATSGNSTPGATCTSTEWNENLTTPSIVGNMNCPVITPQVTPPFFPIELPASPTALELGALSTALELGPSQ